MMNVVESVVVIVLVCVGRCDLALANSSRSPKPFHNYGAWPPGWRVRVFLPFYTRSCF